MKLETEILLYIQNVVKTCQLVGIDSVIIETNSVRAFEDSAIVLLQNDNIPTLPFQAIGINRINTFVSRLEIVKLCNNFTVEAVIDEKRPFVRSLTMKGKGIKVDYRCANPETIRAPKQINDILKYSIKLNAEAIAFLAKGQTAMQSDLVTIISNETGISFELADVNGDVFSYSLEHQATPLTQDNNIKFAYRYPVKTLLTLFKHDPQNTFEVGQKGILKIKINSLNIFTIPQV